MPSYKPYCGSARKLVLAFDVGTTFSAVSYCILNPGKVPKILAVSSYPAQEHVGGDIKIPSILYYDRQGAVKAVGAEALRQHVIDQAEEEDWVKVEWWLLHLRPKHLASSHIKDKDIPPLPRGKSAAQVLADFLRYLFGCARNHIIESHPRGASMWKSVENNIEFILTHPNGCEGLQQRRIRSAARAAGLVPRGEKGARRIHLLTKGEASLHFWVAHVLESGSLPGLHVESIYQLEKSGEDSDHQGIVVIDAGQSTINLSAYSVRLSPPRTFEEIAPAECRLQGSAFVTQRAHTFLRAKLAHSRYGSPDIVQQMTEIFDKTTRFGFRDAREAQYIRFGNVPDKDLQCDIRAGQLKLSGGDVAKFFEPSAEAIADAFKKQQEEATMLQVRIKHAFLLGSFSASDFLYRSLQLHPAFSGVQLSRLSPNDDTAIANGAVSSYVDRLVSSRTLKYTYGVECGTKYIPSRADHRERRHMKFTSITGRTLLPNGFRPILEKGFQVQLERQEFRQSFSYVETLRSQLTHVEVPILAYKGNVLNPHWVDDEPKRFKIMCTVNADTSTIARTLRQQHGPKGRDYYRLDFQVILYVGPTRLKAQISWKHEGVEKRGPASIVYTN